ncbi:MAG: hypothetical protein ACLFVU_14975 [Phycisphaerae bacterium]
MKMLIGDLAGTAVGIGDIAAERVKDKFKRAGASLVLLWFAATLMLGACGLLVASAFIAIAAELGAALAALLTGGGILLLAAIGFLLAWLVDR